MIDVQCLNLTSTSHCTSYMSTKKALDRAAQLKRRKHESSVIAAGAVFIPFIVSCQSQIGTEALALLDLLAKRAIAPFNMDYRLLVSLTIQKAVARSVLWACAASRRGVASKWLCYDTMTPYLV